MSSSSPLRRGFTLVELLVVITIIGMLMGLLLPAVQNARESGRRASCSNNIRNLSLAMQQYESAQQILPINWGEGSNPDGQAQTNYGHSWISMVLPYIDARPLYDRIKFGQLLTYKDSTKNNMEASLNIIPLLRCPSEFGAGLYTNQKFNLEQEVPGTCYKACAGSNYTSTFNSVKSNRGRNKAYTSDIDRGNGVICRGFSKVSNMNSTPRVRSVPLYTTAMSDIVDGSSNTIAIGEACPSFCSFSAWYWWDGATATCGIKMNNQPVRGFTQAWGDNRGNSYGFMSRHPGGANFAFADGSVKWLNEGIEPATYCALATIDGREILQPY